MDEYGLEIRLGSIGIRANVSDHDCHRVDQQDTDGNKFRAGHNVENDVRNEV